MFFVLFIILVPESWLINFYTNATKELQSNCNDEGRKSTLMTRHIVEIVEFLTPRKNTKSLEEQGRTSGSVEWRTARGEIGEIGDKKTHVFQPTETDVANKRMRIRYYPVKDRYVLNDGTVINGWQGGVHFTENIHRKVESDWKMVYLARMEGTEYGTIKWSIDTNNTNLKISHVNVKVSSQLYGAGTIDFEVYSEVHTMNVTDDGSSISTDRFTGSKSLHLNVSLKGSEGAVAWQHAQLFRCSELDEEFVGLELDVQLMD